MVKKALLVGINYTSQNPNAVQINTLNGCLNDVENMRLFLTQHAGYENKNIVVLTDETDLKPTRSNIQDALVRLSANANEGDTLVFHYSGHGTSIDDFGGGNETDGKDEVIVPLDCFTAGIISDDWLYKNFVSQIPKGAKLYCFMDCCHSGTMLDLRCNYKSQCNLKPGRKLASEFFTGDWTHSFSLSLEPSNEVSADVYVLSGCLDKQTSLDTFVKNRYQGAFTFCLLETLYSKLQDGKLKIHTFMDILREVNCRLHIHNFFGQDSQFSCDNQSDFMKTFDI